MAYKDIEKQRAATRAHYYKHKPIYKARAKAHKNKTKVAVRDWLCQYLMSHPCVDCGERDIVVLGFDHKNPRTKLFVISNFRSKTLLAVIAEVAKCDVRCANCNRRKTHYASHRMRWYLQTKTAT